MATIKQQVIGLTFSKLVKIDDGTAVLSEEQIALLKEVVEATAAEILGDDSIIVEVESDE